MDEQESQNEPSFEESYLRILATLPVPVQEYITGSSLPDTAHALTTKYRLHLDQGTILQRELMLVLMGIEEPKELVQALQEEAGIAPETVNAILEEINRDVFQSLQARMRTATSQGPVSADSTPVISNPLAQSWQPSRPAAPNPAPAVPSQTTRQAPPPNLPGADIDPNIGMSPWPPEQVVVYSAPQAAGPAMPSQPMPTTVPQAQMPRPQAFAPQPAPAPQMQVSPPKQAATQAQQPGRPIIKEYASDPYHEPIE